MNLRIDGELRSLLFELGEGELQGLEERILAEGIRDPLVVWRQQDTILDGHHRYEIAQRHGFHFDVVYLDFNSKDEAKVWMIDNQNSRRNMNRAKHLELGERKADILRPWAEANRAATSKDAPRDERGHLQPVSQKSDKPAVDTLKEAADYAGVSRDTASKWRYVRQHAPDELKEQTLNGDVSINSAYSKTKKEQKRKDYLERLDSISSKEVEAPVGEYDVVVIDPPWPMHKIEREVAPNQSEFDYPTMSEEELSELEIPCADDCHIWLWTTHRFLPMAFRLLKAWGLKYVCTFVWNKPGGFQPFDLPQYNCEFALYARKGSPQFVTTKAFFTSLNAPRGKHSEKPEEFYEMVRRVTAGRRLDMFNRRPIEGFSRWGNEA